MHEVEREIKQEILAEIGKAHGDCPFYSISVLSVNHPIRSVL